MKSFKRKETIGDFLVSKKAKAAKEEVLKTIDNKDIVKYIKKSGRRVKKKISFLDSVIL